jgi:hypothetical protein
LERLVPVHEVGQEWQGVRVERVKPGAKHVRAAPLVDEHRHLRFAHGELAAVRDLHVLHRVTVGQSVVPILGPMDDFDELLADEILK